MVSRRKAKKAEKMQTKNQGMTLDEAYKILEKEPTLVNKSVYEEALKQVEAEDAGFAAEIRAFNKAKAKEDALRNAYQIVGGYKNTISSNLYARAMALVEADDPDFARKLQALFENGTTFKDASDEQLATAEQIVDNAQVIEHEYNNDRQLKEDVFNDDIRQAIDNTIVPDISDEDKDDILFRTGQQEVITEVTKDVDFARAEPEEKHKMLIGRIRDSIKRTLIRSRLSSGAKPRDAIDFSKKLKTMANSVTNAYETAYKKATSFINRLSADGHKKAAIWLNKAKTKAHKAMVSMVTTSVLLTSLLPSCNSGSGLRTPSRSEEVQKTVVMKDTTKTSAAVVTKTKAQANVQATAAVDSVSVSQAQNIVKTEKTQVNSGTAFVTENDGGSSTVVEEAAPQYTLVEEAGSNRVVSEVKTDTITPTVKILKGNNLNDGVQIGTASADELVGRTVTNKRDILVEGLSAQDSIAAETPFTFEDAQGNATISSADSLATSSQGSSFVFEEEQGSSTTLNTDSVSNFNSVSTVALTDSTATADSVQIVSDSENLPKGTLAAGNVPERGGYENTGLISKRQYTNLKNWYVTRYGDNAFDVVMEKITTEMLAKGGAFEGLSKEQALRVAEGIMVHSNLFPESAEAIEAFLNPCKDAKLTAEQIEQIRKDGYNITEEGLVTDGVYKKAVYARFYKTGDCEEAGHVVYKRTGSARTTTASNQYYGRLYQYKPTRTEPITFTFDQEQGSSRTEVTYVYDETEPVVKKYKGNNLNIEDSKYLGEISAAKVAGAKTNNKKDILVEKTAAATTFTFADEGGSSSTNFTFEEENGSAQTVATPASENVQTSKVTESQSSQSKSSTKAKKSKVKKKKKDAEQKRIEAEKMARLKYWQEKFHKS